MHDFYGYEEEILTAESEDDCDVIMSSSARYQLASSTRFPILSRPIRLGLGDGDLRVNDNGRSYGALMASGSMSNSDPA